MADRELINYAEMNGTYDGVLMETEKTTDVLVVLAGVSFSKSANKSIWINGELQFTITIDNSKGEGEMTNVIINDPLDTTMFLLDEDTIVVTLDGAVLVKGTGYTVDYTAPNLKVTFLVPIPAAKIATISFRGTKVPAP